MEVLADGKRPLKERLTNLNFDRVPNQDYKQALIDQQEYRKYSIHWTIQAIRIIPDDQVKIIAAALYAEMPASKIADQLKISRQRIYQIIHLFDSKTPPNPTD